LKNSNKINTEITQRKYTDPPMVPILENEEKETSKIPIVSSVLKQSI